MTFSAIWKSEQIHLFCKVSTIEQAQSTRRLRPQLLFALTRWPSGEPVHCGLLCLSKCLSKISPQSSCLFLNSWSGSQSLRCAYFRDVLSHTREGWATWRNDRIITPRYHLGELQDCAVMGLAVNHHCLTGMLREFTGAFMR